jgi:hypothetical protein
MSAHRVKPVLRGFSNLLCFGVSFITFRRQSLDLGSETTRELAGTEPRNGNAGGIGRIPAHWGDPQIDLRGKIICGSYEESIDDQKQF